MLIIGRARLSSHEDNRRHENIPAVSEERTPSLVDLGSEAPVTLEKANSMIYSRAPFSSFGTHKYYRRERIAQSLVPPLIKITPLLQKSRS